MCKALFIILLECQPFLDPTSPNGIQNEIVKDFGAHLFELEKPPNPKEALSRFAHRYASDFNHMNMNGHQFLAEEIMKIVNRELDSYPANPRRGTWGEGDLCYSWYQTGIVPLQYASLVEIEQYDPRNEKYALSTCKVGLLLIILLIHPDI